jgi:TM2 domain-containing membrane protein YozV
MSAYSYPNPNPQAMFYQHYEAVRRDEVVGILLALFLGTFGIHQFYLHRTGLGILYCCFCWTGIPTLLGFIECFFMAGRVREYNAMQAAGIAAMLGIPVPLWNQPGSTPANPYLPPVSPVQPAGAVPMTGLVPAGGFVPAAGFVAAVPVVAQTTCANCQRVNPPGAKFCVGCGGAL